MSHRPPFELHPRRLPLVELGEDFGLHHHLLIRGEMGILAGLLLSS